ncbi:unnamed protein product [Tenebrio molitor]|nr:unnamed protein product [Tenebrio molitor]
MTVKLLSLFVIVTVVTMCQSSLYNDGNPYLRSLPAPAPMASPPPEEDDSFDIYLSYPKDVTNIDKMYLKCEWYELEDAHVAVALSDDTPTAL